MPSAISWTELVRDKPETGLLPPGRTHRYRTATIRRKDMRHMKTSDLSLLRGMVDAGNEEAGNRLAELAAGRGDLAELQRLADEGNDEAANRLSDFIRNTT